MGWGNLDLGNQEEAKKYYQLAIHIADSAWGANSGSSNTYRNNLAFYHLQKANSSKRKTVAVSPKLL